MIRVEIETLKVALPQELVAGAEAGLREALFDAALTAANNAKSLIMRGGRSGKIYGRGAKIRRGKNKGKYRRYHQASAPGEPPKTDLGFLANNVLPEASAYLRASLVSKAPYSAALEFGTRRNGGPRPFFRVSAKVGAERFAKVVNVYIQKHTRTSSS